EVAGADVIEIAGDPEGIGRLVPLLLRRRRRGDGERPAGGACGLPHRSLTMRLSGADAAADVDGAETGLAPVHDEHAEALLHARLDVLVGRGVAAGNVDLLARGEHLLDGGFPALLVAGRPAVGADRREDAAQRAGA